MEEAQSGRKERNHRRGIIPRQRKDLGSARFIVILNEPGGVVLEIFFGQKMFSNCPGRPRAQAIVKMLVVSEIESLLLESPFHVPVHFSHESKAGMLFPHRCDRFRPEGGVNRKRSFRWDSALAPRSAKHVWLDEHRHVTANTITQIRHAA